MHLAPYQMFVPLQAIFCRLRLANEQIANKIVQPIVDPQLSHVTCSTWILV